MSTTPTSSLSERLAAAKSTVKNNPWKTFFSVLGVILFVVLLGLGIHYLIQRFHEPATVTSNLATNDASVTSGSASSSTVGTATNGATTATPNTAATTSSTASTAATSSSTTATAAGPVTATDASAKDVAKTVADLANNTVPWWQREFATLPALQACSREKYNAVPFPYDARNQYYGAQAFGELHADKGDLHPDGEAYAAAAAARGDTASEIYARSKSNGIALLNRGAIRDPEKMLPRVDPNTEYNRLFQVGASISDIQKYLPKTADLMKMARERPSGLAFQIPRERPPLYTEGINCERRARIPSRASDKNQLFCINPIDPREYYDYRPHPLLDSVLADGGRHPNGGGFSQDAPRTSVDSTSSAARSSQAAAQGSN